jgi:hypothetical protein
MGKHVIDPKSSEISRTTQIALFWPKLFPVLFLKEALISLPF